MEESSANKATELVALSSLHTETALANVLGRQDYVTGEMWKKQISVPPRREHGELSDDWHCKHCTGRGVHDAPRVWCNILPWIWECLSRRWKN